MTETASEELEPTGDGDELETTQEVVDEREEAAGLAAPIAAPVEPQEGPQEPSEAFDPGKHTVDEVLEYLEGASGEETRRVMHLESIGKDRSSIIGDGSQVPVIEDPGDGYQRVYVSG